MLIEWKYCNAFDWHAENAVAVLVVGSCEQHSTHMPLGTDSILGESICRDAAEKTDVPVLLLPTQNIGFSPHHRAFNGFLTLSHKVMFDYIMEVCVSVFENGCSKLIIVNSHGGNQSCLQSVVNELGASYGKSPVLLRYWDLIAGEIDSIRDTPSGGMGHAGEFETSLMLHYHPEYVLKDKMENFDPAKGTDWYNPDMFAKNKIYTYQNFDRYSAKGNIGQPQYATAEKGKKQADIIVEKLVSFIEFYLVNNP